MESRDAIQIDDNLMPSDPKDPRIQMVFPSTVPPKSALQFQPPGNNKDFDLLAQLIKYGEGKKIVRNIYYGVPYDPFEVQKLEELYVYIQKQQFQEIEREFPEFERLKFLQANEFKIKETVVAML